METLNGYNKTLKHMYGSIDKNHLWIAQHVQNTIYLLPSLFRYEDIML